VSGGGESATRPTIALVEKEIEFAHRQRDQHEHWLVPSVILGRIDARAIAIAPAIIGLGFGAMVFAAIAGQAATACSSAARCGGRSPPGHIRSILRT
jgi:hypothetical protein